MTDINLHQRKVIAVVPTVIPHPLREPLVTDLARQPEVRDVIVIDNGDNYSMEVAEDPALRKIKIRKPRCNLNWLGACNYAAAEILTSYEHGNTREPKQNQNSLIVCFINDDLVLSNNFFQQILPVFDEKPDAGLLVPQYDGRFCPEASCNTPAASWAPAAAEKEVDCIDGTCLILPVTTLATVGLLDPHFRHPGWGADADYAYRVRQSGQKIYVTSRGRVWHANYGEGGTSAKVVYGSAAAWQERGRAQAQQDLHDKYGPNWRQILSIPANTL